MTTEEWKDIICALKESGFLDMTIVGGDIFLKENIFELINFSINNGFRVGTTINGYTVTESLAKALMKTNISSITLSLDDITHKLDEDIRGIRNAAEKVKYSLTLLKKFNNGSTTLSLGMIIMKSTIGSIKEVVQYGVQNNLKVGFSLIHFTHYFSDTTFSREQYELSQTEQEELHEQVKWLGRMRRKHPNLLPRFVELEWIRKYFNDYRQKKTPCYHPLFKICVQPNGDVKPCCSMESVGNLTKQGVDEILRSDRCVSLLKKALLKDCPGCSCRYNLNLRVSMAARIREYLYRLGVVKL